MARSRLPAWAPGLAALRNYRLADLPHDVTGGIAVAAVTVPVGIANAQLAGLPPSMGSTAASCRWWSTPCSAPRDS